jgi:hypothetical protein
MEPVFLENFNKITVLFPKEKDRCGNAFCASIVL